MYWTITSSSAAVKFDCLLWALLFEGLPAILACKVVRGILNCFVRYRVLNLGFVRFAVIARIMRDSIVGTGMIVVEEIVC